MQYRVVYPISHSGQRLEPGTIVSDGDTFGTLKKSGLAIGRLLSGGRIVPVPVSPGAPSQPPAVPNESEPAGHAEGQDSPGSEKKPAGKRL